MNGVLPEVTEFPEMPEVKEPKRRMLFARPSGQLVEFGDNGTTTVGNRLLLELLEHEKLCHEIDSPDAPANRETNSLGT